MSSTISRWEGERAAWLVARSRPGTSARRRAQLLARRHRQRSRGGMGVSASVLQEDVTPSLFRRMLDGGDDPTEKLARLVAVPLLYAVTYLTVGPAIGAAWGMYGLRWRTAARTGPLRAWPWACAAAALAGLGIAVHALMEVPTGAWIVPWPPALHLYLPIALPQWMWVQAVLACAHTAWLIRSHGWAAVRSDALPKPEKDSRGNWLATPEEEKARLSVTDEEEVVESGDRPAPPGALPKLVLSVDPDIDEPLPDPVDEEAPLFDDDFIEPTTTSSEDS